MDRWTAPVRLLTGLAFVIAGLPKFVAHDWEARAFDSFGLPAEEAEMQNDRFDASLVTLVEDFQRKNRLAVDGIAGVQTQVALDAALNDAATPFLHNSAGS